MPTLGRRDLYRVCLTVGSPGESPRNLHFGPGGQYYGIAYAQSGRGYFSRSDLWYPPMNTNAVVVEAGGTVTDPIAAEDDRSILRYCYSQGGGVLEKRSTDDGNTWGDAVTIFSAGTRPYVVCDRRTGIVLYACLDGTAIKGRLQAPGDTTPGAEFTFKDASGVNLVVQDTAFSVSPAYNATARWLLVVRQSGEIRNYYSTDDGQTWTEIA